MFLKLSLIVVEVVAITLIDTTVVGSYYSLDVFYCLPVLQAARLGAIHAMRKTDTQLPVYFAIFTAIVWSLAEAIILPNFPLSAFLLNVFSRSVAFTVIARVMAKLWKEREYGVNDVLTQLNNRAEFLQRFEMEQIRSERSRKAYSVLFIDIDKFKDLNDKFGHTVGDQALKKVSEILRQNSRKVDVVARIGGDEFALLFPETDEKSCASVLNRIKTDADAEFQKHGWPISLSIGSVTASGEKRTIEEILHDADQIMFSVKRAKQ